jgi:carbonic anhydrase
MALVRYPTQSRFKDLEKSVEEDVAFLKEHPLVDNVPISGYNVRLSREATNCKYDVTTGKIHKVV